jgi:hypothetical protein
MEGTGSHPGMASTTRPRPVYCFTGTVLLVPDAAPVAGALVGHLHTPIGVAVPLIQAPSSIGPVAVTAVNGQNVTICGSFLLQDGYLVLEATLVQPGENATTPGVSPLALLVLALLGLLPVAG